MTRKRQPGVIPTRKEHPHATPIYRFPHPLGVPGLSERKENRLYGKLTLDFPDSPKIAPLSDNAFRTMVEMILWSRRLLTDGHIPLGISKRWRKKSIDELLSNDPTRPSLTKTEGGYLIHDFSEHQTTRDDLDVKRSAGSKGGQAKAANAKKAAEGGSGNVAPATEVLYQTASNTLATRAHTETETETETTTAKAVVVPRDAPRPDVEAICTLLADLIQGNGSKRPMVGKGWLTEARLLLDKDGYEQAQIERLIRWCQADAFWKTIVLSMPKFRAKYDQLRLQANREREVRQQQQAPPERKTQARKNFDSLASKYGYSDAESAPVVQLYPERKELAQ